MQTRAIFIVSALLAVGVAGLFLRKPAPPPVQVLRSELAFANGKVSLKGSDAPFTGLMLERYPDGALKSRSAICNGVLHGLSEGFHTNGQVEVAEHYVDGTSHGLRTKWNFDGAKNSEAQVDHGKIQGTFKRWHSNGVLAEEIRMKDGVPDGPSTAWHLDGSLRAKAVLKDGKVVERRSWKPGEAEDAGLLVASRPKP